MPGKPPPSPGAKPPPPAGAYQQNLNAPVSSLSPNSAPGTTWAGSPAAPAGGRRPTLPAAVQNDITLLHQQSSADLWKDVVYEGYVMKRNGVGFAATHYWDVRFCVIEKDCVRFYSDQTKESEKVKVFPTKFIPGTSVCFTFQREMFHEGKRRYLFGMASKGNPKKPSFVLDAESRAVRDEFLAAFESCGCSRVDQVQAPKKDSNSLKEGWLVKKGMTWHQRYVCLMPQMIVYYKVRSDKHPAGVVPLSKGTAIKDAFQAGLVKRKNVLLIEAEHSDKNVYFQCYDALAFSTWKAAIEKCISGM